MTFHIIFTSTNQEVFFDQSQFISVDFLVFSLVISCCVCILTNPAVFDLSPVSVSEQKLS